jgi:hypothetical protein
MANTWKASPTLNERSMRQTLGLSGKVVTNFCAKPSRPFGDRASKGERQPRSNASTTLREGLRKLAGIAGAIAALPHATAARQVDPWENLLDQSWGSYKQASEHWSVTSKWNTGTTVQSVPNRHVLAIEILSFSYDSGWVDDGNGYLIKQTGSSIPYVPSPGATGCHPGEAGADMVPGTAPVSSGGTYYPAMGPSDGSLIAHVPFTGYSGSAELTIMVKSRSTYDRKRISDGVTVYSSDQMWWTRHNLIITKNLVDTTAITTRKVYSVPNKEGAVPADPNGRLRHIGFPNWTFRGGLFVGILGPENQFKDRSGTSRIQGRHSTAIGDDHRLMVLSMASPGRLPDDHGYLSVGLYFPRNDTLNLNEPVSTMTWDKRWTVTPKGEDGDNFKYHEKPYSTVEFAPETLADYANFKMPKFFAPETVGPEYLDTAKTIFALCAPESSASPPTLSWRYFASDELEADHTSGLENDSRPRIWTVRMGSVQSWNGW